MNASLVSMWERVKANWAGLAIGLALLVGLGMSGAYLDGQSESYASSAGEAARCRNLAQQILAVRGAAPLGRGESTHANGDASDPIANAADTAGIGPENIDRIEHQAAQRIGSSPYVRALTGISLKGVSMQQVVAFLGAMDAGPHPLLAQSLRLSPAASSADTQLKNGGELWDVALSVASMRYNPAAGRSR